MIVVTRLHGSALALNCDLIERVEASPRTILTLVDGTRYVVRESVDEVVDKVRAFRASVIALAHRLEREQQPAPATRQPPQYRNMGVPSTWRTSGR
jgi:flagellar protein FlbD